MRVCKKGQAEKCGRRVGENKARRGKRKYALSRRPAPELPTP